MKKSKLYFESFFSKYPDVVTLAEFRNMLGGISDAAARKLMRENRVKHYYIDTTYFIPKVWIIEYVLSDDYEQYKKKLKVQI